MPDPTTPPPLGDREKVARATFETRDDPYDTAEWEDLDSTDRERWFCYADAVLAVLDLPARDRKNRAQGWDEGYGDCWTYHQSHGLAGTETNPYTQEAPDAR